MKKLIKTLIILFILINIKVYGQEPPTPGPCYNMNGCIYVRNYDNFFIMGCEVRVDYIEISCPNNVYSYDIIGFEIIGDNCDALITFLHPQNNLDSDRYMEIIDSLYKELFDYKFYQMRQNYICPITAQFIYWWEGSCNMACEILLANGRRIFKTVSCQSLACCGKHYNYCWDEVNESARITEFTYWVGTACPIQTAPDFTKCPSVGSIYNGVTVIQVYASYCKSSCYE